MNNSVLVAGPSPERRAAFVEALLDTPHRLAGVTGRADNVLELVGQHHPWGVAVDLAFPSAVELVKRILAKHPEVTVLALYDETTQREAVEARRAGASEALPFPVQAPRLLRALASLAAPGGQSATRKFLAMRHRTSLSATYKAANEGFLTRRRSAVAVEIGMTDVVVQAGEAFAEGRELAATIQLPGQGPLHVQVKVTRIEPLPGFGRYSMTLAWHDLKDYDRERLKAFCRGLTARVTSGVPAVAGR